MVENESLVSLVSRGHVLERLSRQYRLFGNEEQIFLGAVAEAIRSTILESAELYDRATSSLHVANILNRIAGYFPDDCGFENKYSAKQVLGLLSDIGDVSSIGEGYWWPVKERLLSIPNTDVKIVLGTLPSSTLEGIIKVPVHSHGLARSVLSKHEPSHLETLLDQQSIDSWIGRQPVDLVNWTESFLLKIKSKLKPISLDNPTVSVFTQELNSRRKYVHWVQLDDLENPPSNYCLARFTHYQHGYSQYSYSVVEIKPCQVDRNWKVNRHFELNREDARLLMFGLGRLYGNGLPYRILKKEHGIVFSTLYDLPVRESKIQSFAIKLEHAGSVWRMYLFPTYLQQLISTVVNRLGMNFLESPLSKN